MADGIPGPSPEEMGITQEDIGFNTESNPQTHVAPNNSYSPPAIPLQPQPQFIRKFSRAGSSEERSTLAAQIRAKRKEHFDTKTERSSKEAELTKGLEELAAIEAALAEIPDIWYARVLNRRRLSELRSQLNDQEDLNSAIQAELSAMAYTERRLTEEGMPVTRLDQARKMVNEFYESEKAKWEDTPYEKEDLSTLFSDEHLASLSTEDYITLLRRFPSDMVTHVTRQGIRDHTGISEHTLGLGKYSNGFKEIINEGKIHSALGAYTKNGISEEAINSYLESLMSRGLNLDDALYEISNAADLGLVPAYHDRTSVHLAAGEVADSFYGAESGNEIFFAFPSAYIASQHFFGGETYLSEKASKSTRETTPDRNNIYVWTENNDGISINSGLVFIPKDTQVDRNTGSKYAIDQNNEPIRVTGEDGKESYQLATDTISSEEYWENYFKDHPDQKPKRIVYHEGGNPTQALLDWRKDNGLSTFADSRDLGFPEREIGTIDDPRANLGYERFRSLVKRALENFSERHQLEEAA